MSKGRLITALMCAALALTWAGCGSQHGSQKVSAERAERIKVAEAEWLKQEVARLKAEEQQLKQEMVRLKAEEQQLKVAEMRYLAEYNLAAEPLKAEGVKLTKATDALIAAAPQKVWTVYVEAAQAHDESLAEYQRDSALIAEFKLAQRAYEAAERALEDSATLEWAAYLTARTREQTARTRASEKRAIWQKWKMESEEAVSASEKVARAMSAVEALKLTAERWLKADTEEEKAVAEVSYGAALLSYTAAIDAFRRSKR